MIQLEQGSSNGFEIRCSSCGVRIRRDSNEDVPGLCLTCFYRALNDRLRAQRNARAGEGISDR